MKNGNKVSRGMVLLLSLLGAALPGFAQALEVSVLPKGELNRVDTAMEIAITFSQPMAAVGAIRRDFVPDFVTITPAVAGTFYWAGDRILKFHPAKLLPFATAFEVRIAKTAKSLNGSTLAGEHVSRFETPAPVVLGVTPRPGATIRKRDPLVLRFNQPVALAEIEARVKLAHRPAAYSVPDGFTLTSPEARAEIERVNAAPGVTTGLIPVKAWYDKGDTTRVVVAPQTDLPLNASVRLVVDRGLRGTQGPLGSRKAQEFEFGSARSFLFGGISCQSCNPYDSITIAFSNPVPLKALAAGAKVIDLAAGQDASLRNLDELEEWEWHEYGVYEHLSLSGIFALKAGRRYRLLLSPELTDSLGQKLGRTLRVDFAIQDYPPSLELVNRTGIIESAGPKALSLKVMNLEAARMEIRSVADSEIGRYLDAANDYRRLLVGESSPPLRLQCLRNVSTIVNLGVDRHLPAGSGVLYAEFTAPNPADAKHPLFANGLLQVTDIGLSFKYSLHNSLIYTSSLATGAPLANCRLEIFNLAGKSLWQGVSDGNGLCMAPGLEELGAGKESWQPRLVVVARKGDDRAFLSEQWNSGIEGWSFNLEQDWRNNRRLGLGFLFSDRGAYRPGDEVFVKAIFRIDERDRLHLPPDGPVSFRVTDSRNREVFKTESRLNPLGAASFSFTLPGDGPTGSYRVQATPPEAWSGEKTSFHHTILVAEYRKPDFRVDVAVDRKNWIAGETLAGQVKGAYLYGGAMKESKAQWTLRLAPTGFEPPLSGALAGRPFVFQDWTRDEQPEYGGRLAGSGEGKLGPGGELAVEQELAFAPFPQSGVLEGEVTDVTSQAIANRSSFLLHPAPVYIGIESGAYFTEAGKPFRTSLIAAAIDGTPVAGKAVRVELVRREWHSVQEKQEGAYYRYRSEAVDTVVQTREVQSATGPLALEFPLAAAGYYLLRASYTDAPGRTVTSGFGFYCLGGGFVAWERYDHNRMDLVPEKKRYRPGETARILVKSPWPEAEGFLTVERTGVIHSRPLRLSGSVQVVEVPVGRDHIPEVFVSVLLAKGRSAEKLEGGVDVGKPTFRLGYARLEIVPDEVGLKVSVASDKSEYRPQEKVTVDLQVRQRDGRGASAEVTLYAVDYGVLSLTGYRLPDPGATFYGHRGLGVRNADSRLVLISRDYLKGKLAEEGGGGGADGGLLALRRDFRATPFWQGSLMTDGKGNARASFTLPDSLTTFVLMAVAHTADSRFGSAQREIRVAKPLMLFSALPRFLLSGDACHGAVRVQNNTALPGRLRVRAQALNGRVALEATEQELELGAHASAVVRFPIRAVAAGGEKLRFLASFKAAGREESDALEIRLPVNAPRTRIDAAATGSSEGRDATRVALPEGIHPDLGGLRLTLSSSALAGLEKSADYLLDYPYGCTEQLTSKLMPFIALKNMAGAFSFRNLSEAEIDRTVAETLAKIYKNQRGDGGFGTWSDSPTSFPYLSAYVLFTLKMAENRGVAVDAGVKNNLAAYLRRLIKERLPLGWDSSLVSRAFMLYALSLNGTPDSSTQTQVFEKRQQLPLLVRAMLLSTASRDRGAAAMKQTLLGEILNAARLEAASAHFEEGSFSGGQVLMHSSLRSNALALMALLDAGDTSTLPEKVAVYLLGKRRNGFWRNTQENAWSLLALSEYYRRRESQPIDFQASVRLGDRKLPATTFREIRSEIVQLAMEELTRLAPNRELEVAFEKSGSGRLFWGVSLSFYPTGSDFQEVNQGVALQRVYEDLGTGERKSTFRQGDLVRVRLKLQVTAEKNYLAIDDPIPAGCEIQDSALQTTRQQDPQRRGGNSWYFNHVEAYDDRLQVFADLLPAGSYEFTYTVRATAAGTFLAPGAKAEEMYNPEVFGTSRADTIRVE